MFVTTPITGDRQIDRQIDQTPDRSKMYGYRMRDDSRRHPLVQAHLRTENRYTASVMADTVQLQELMYNEMRAHIKEDTSAPLRYCPDPLMSHDRHLECRIITTTQECHRTNNALSTAEEGSDGIQTCWTRKMSGCFLRSAIPMNLKV